MNLKLPATPEEVRRHVLDLIDAAGSQSELARKAGVGHQEVGMVARGERPPTGTFLAYLGLRRETVYVKARR